jgi:hypothetical protein
MVHDPRDPSSFLTNVVQRYQSMRSYRDEGRIVAEFKMRLGAFTTNASFRTCFLRPDRFRFEHRSKSAPFVEVPESEWNRYLAWMEGGECRSWWTLQPIIERRASIFEPLGAAAGISSGSSVNIPKLLLPGSSGPSVLPSVDQVSAVQPDRLEGVECLRIDAHSVGTTSRKLWVGAESLLLMQLWESVRFTKEIQLRQDEATRKAVEGPEFAKRFTPDQIKRMLEREPPSTEEFTVETVTSYRPEADVDIDAGAFVVEIPG